MKYLNTMGHVWDDLVKAGLLTADQMEVAQATRESLGGDIADIVIRKGFISEKNLIKAVGKRLGISVVSLTNYSPHLDTLKMLPSQYAHKWRVFPLFQVEGKIILATEDPLNLEALDEIRTVMGFPVDPVLALGSEIDSAISAHYRTSTPTKEAKASVVVVGEGIATTGSREAESEAAIQKQAVREDVVQKLNTLLYQAYAAQASDLHVEPMRSGLRVRVRVDGMLEELPVLPTIMQMPIISRIKILAGLDVSEHRISQDGRFRMTVDSVPVDIRISVYPTMFGEAAAIRLLQKDQVLSLDSLGFMPNDLTVFKKLIRMPHGVFLVTGPTGCGKSTTLYAALQHINNPKQHILSIEDPIEHEITGVDQTQIHVRAGVTFATALRSVLRQDPDIIMVGEIRDGETAEIVTRAAMTGHLVLSTLHTNTAVGAISRLMDLQVPQFLVANTLLGVMAQRLVRKICPSCKENVTLPEPARQLLGEVGQSTEEIPAFQGKGCKKCRMTGYRGRIAIFEIFEADEEIRVLIGKKTLDLRLQEKLRSTPGYHTLFQDGVEKMRKGLTTFEEIFRVTQQE